MILRKLRRFFILTAEFALLILFIVPLIPNLKESRSNIYLKTSDVPTKIIINGNWTDARDAGICSGNGTPESPFTIEDLDILGDGVGNCITIYNAYEYFIIENCTIHGSGTIENDAGIYIENVTNGIIQKNVISGNRYGIFIIHSNNINITYNNIGNERGLKYLTNCTDMWLYMNTFTSTLYDVYFTDISSTTYNTPTQFLYTYKNHNYTNYLGNFYDGLIDDFQDDNNDGISEVPRTGTGGTINTTSWESDKYPLMEPHNNYLLIEPYYPPEPNIPGYQLSILVGMVALLIVIMIWKKYPN